MSRPRKKFSEYSFQKDINYDTFEVCAEGGGNTSPRIICLVDLYYDNRFAHFDNVKKLDIITSVIILKK